MTLTANDFSYLDWNGCDRKNQDLSHYILTGTEINGSDLRGCILNGAKLQNAQLCGTDLTNASLCGADLRDANLQYTKLSGVNLNGANVQGTLFKGCTGLTEETKRELKNRNAIFDNSVSRTSNLKWWIQYVLIPLITLLLGSSGIVGVLEYLKKQSSTSPIPSPTVQSVTLISPSTKPTPITKPIGEAKIRQEPK